jgi:hypothetical protein
MQKKFLSLVVIGLITAMTSNAFAGVIIRDSKGKSDHYLRADTKAGITYFQKCNVSDNACAPLGNENGYPLAIIKKFQHRVLVSRIVTAAGGTFVVGGMAGIIVMLATLGILAPPVGALTVAGYIGVAGSGIAIVGASHDFYKGYRTDTQVSNTLIIGQKGEDHIITVSSMEDYESDLHELLN